MMLQSGPLVLLVSRASCVDFPSTVSSSAFVHHAVATMASAVMQLTDSSSTVMTTVKFRYDCPAFEPEAVSVPFDCMLASCALPDASMSALLCSATSWPRK